jgi:hypothetical protein
VVSSSRPTACRSSDGRPARSSSLVRSRSMLSRIRSGLVRKLMSLLLIDSESLWRKDNATDATGLRPSGRGVEGNGKKKSGACSVRKEDRI